MSKFKAFFNKVRSYFSTKALAACAAVCAVTTCAFAENEVTNPLATVQAEAEAYIGAGKETVIALLSAGLVIVAAFYIWRLIKKGISGAK